MCLTAISKLYRYCFITQHCPRPDWILGSLFHPHCLPWPLLHSSSVSSPSSSALQQLPRPCVISYCSPLLERGKYNLYSSYIKGLLMSSDALGRQAGGHGCRETLCSRGASATCAPAHTQPSRTILGDRPALAQQLPFIAFCGNSVIDVIIRAP